jgi:hypothetical protein
MEEIYTGVLLDERPELEKERDVQFGEIVGSAAPVQWREKSENEWRKFPEKNQKRSNMCGPFSFVKLLGIYWWLRYGVFIDFSEEDIYQRRSPKVAGMSIPNLYSIVGKGVTLKVLTNVEIESDADADNAIIEDFKRDVGKVFAVGDPIYVPLDIDTIASIMQQTGKALHCMIAFKVSEYSKYIPEVDGQLNLYAPATSRHFVALTDFGLVNGKKYIRCEDSAHFGGFSSRLFSEEWIKNRAIAVTYPMNFKFEDNLQPISLEENGTVAPIFEKELHYTKIFSFDPDVVKMQDLMKKEGVFPLNIESTGWFGPLTAQSLYTLQVRYKVASLEELNELQGKVAGPKTIKLLNQLANKYK